MNVRRQLTRIVLVLIALASAVACGTKIDPVQSGDAALPAGTCLGYQSVIKPLLERHCTSCHASTLSGAARHGAPGTVDLDSYAGVVAAADRARVRVVDGTMPPGGGIADAERTHFADWVDAGKPEQCTATDAGTADRAPADAAASDRDPAGCIDYQHTMKPLIDNRCSSCHASTLTGAARNGAPAGVDLDSYAAVTANLARALYRVVSSGMPPGGGVPQSERDLWVVWVEQGAIEVCTAFDAGAIDAAGSDAAAADSAATDGQVVDGAVVDGAAAACVPYEPTVRLLVENNCATCHASTVTGTDRNGAPVGVDFETYIKAVNWAEPMRRRIVAGTMPPGAPLAADQQTAFANWVAVGVPQTCVLPDGGIADSGGSDASIVACSSGSYYIGGFGEFMHPGDNCMGCHAGTEAPQFVTAATVMGALHDVNDCNGVPGVTIEIRDATTAVTQLVSNTWGNFYLDSLVGALTPPYTVRLILGGRQRTMVNSRNDLNCVHCHTAAGLSGAPGRILAP